MVWLGGKARRFWLQLYKRNKEGTSRDHSGCMVSGVAAFGGMSEDRLEEFHEYHCKFG